MDVLLLAILNSLVLLFVFKLGRTTDLVCWRASGVHAV
jgi:hypothetical protein